MTRTEQYKVNCECVYVFDNAMHEYDDAKLSYKDSVNLRSCNARVYETENFFILRSYFTFVAVIDKKDNLLIDMMRHEYGYTATSCSHISKFFKDYAPNIKTAKKLVWRNL